MDNVPQDRADGDGHKAWLNKHYGYLLRHCRGRTGKEAEALDLAQETCLRAIKYYPANRITPGLLRTIADHALFDLARRATSDKKALSKYAAKQLEEAFEELEVAEAPDFKDALLSQFPKLSAEHQELILVQFRAFCLDKCVGDLADKEGLISRSGLYRKLPKALLRLRQLMECEVEALHRNIPTRSP